MTTDPSGPAGRQAAGALGRIAGLLRNPYLFVVLALLCWSSNWLLGRAMRAETTPLSLSFWRWLAAVLMLLPFTGRHLWHQRAVVAREWKILAAYALTGIGLFHTLVYMALEHTTATNASLVNSATPIMIVIVSWALYRETATWRQLAGILLSMAGVGAIVTQGDPGAIGTLTFNPGDLWALLSVVVISLYNVLLPRRPKELGAMTLVTATAIIALIMLFPFFLWEALTAPTMRFSATTAWLIVYMGLVPSVLAYAFWIPAVMQLGANRVGIFSNLHPFFTTSLAIVVLGESLRAYHVTGIAMILGGIWLATARRLVPFQARRSGTTAAAGPAARGTAAAGERT